MLIQIKITNCIQVCCAHPCFPHVYSRICHLQHVLCQLQTHQGATIDRLRELWNLQGCHGALGEKWCLFFILGFWGMDWPYLNQGSNVTCRMVCFATITCFLKHVEISSTTTTCFWWHGFKLISLCAPGSLPATGCGAGYGGPDQERCPSDSERHRLPEGYHLGSSHIPSGQVRGCLDSWVVLIKYLVVAILRELLIHMHIIYIYTHICGIYIYNYYYIII